MTSTISTSQHADKQSRCQLIARTRVGSRQISLERLADQQFKLCLSETVWEHRVIWEELEEYDRFTAEASFWRWMRREYERQGRQRNPAQLSTHPRFSNSVQLA